MSKPQDLLLSLLEQAQQDVNKRVELDSLWSRVFLKTRDYAITRTSEARSALLQALESLKASFFEIIDKSNLSEEEKTQVRTFVDYDLQRFLDSVNGALLMAGENEKGN